MINEVEYLQDMIQPGKQQCIHNNCTAKVTFKRKLICCKDINTPSNISKLNGIRIFQTQNPISPAKKQEKQYHKSSFSGSTCQSVIDNGHIIIP